MAQRLRNVLSLVASLALCATFLGGRARAAPADPYDAAHDAEARLDYRAVLASATEALKQANSHERLVELYRLLGTANAVLGKNDDAVEAFTRLLAIDPDHRLSRGLSPKITRPFKEAGGYWIDRPGGLGVAADVPRDVAPGKPLTVSVKLDDPLQMAASVRLSYRHEGDPDYVKLEQPVGAPISLSIGSGLSFTIPAEQVTARRSDYNLELYFTALSGSGSELRQAGDPAHPINVTVRAARETEPLVTAQPNALLAQPQPKSRKKSVLTKWWFWTAVGGVVVVGAALGGGLGYYYSRDTTHGDATLSSRIGP
jgi:hypothetical protein